MSGRNPADGVAARNAARHTERTIRMIEQTPAQFRDDVQAWVTALGGRGRRKSRPLTAVTIALYLNFALPVLQEWAETHQSLRSVDTVDIERALSRHSGQSRHNVHTALRSLFRGLKRERRIFADPAREVAGRYTRRILRPLRSDRVHGLFDQLTRPDDRVILALVAVHALTIEEVIGFRLDHLDRSAGRATVTRPHPPHVLVGRVHRRGAPRLADLPSASVADEHESVLADYPGDCAYRAAGQSPLHHPPIP